MAISNPTLLDTQTLQTGFQLNSASISPSANALLVIVHTVLAAKGSGWTDSVTDSFGANLGDWTSIGVEIDGAATVHMWLHYAQCGATPGSGTVSVDPSGTTGRQIMFVLEVTGHNTTSPVTQYKTYSSDATPTSPEITLDSSPASGSLVLGAIGGGVGTTSSDATSGTGFTELADTWVGTTGVTGCAVQYDNGGAVQQHWILLCGKQGDDYIAADPISGTRILFREKYGDPARYIFRVVTYVRRGL